MEPVHTLWMEADHIADTLGKPKGPDFVFILGKESVDIGFRVIDGLLNLRGRVEGIISRDHRDLLGISFGTILSQDASP